MIVAFLLKLQTFFTMTSCDTRFICGSLSENIRKFNGQTKIEQVDECLQQTFGENLPRLRRIMYYDSNKKSLVDLENELRNGSNPFNVNPSIEFYIVDETHSQAGAEDDQIVSDETSNDNSRSMNHDISQMPSTMNDRTLVITSILNKSPEIRYRPQRMRFSLDVKPSQRDVYKSDQFNVRENKTNGRIARVQGCKTDNQRMLQVLPKLQIPPVDFQSNITLLVAVVAEVVENGMTIWYKHSNKGFLPDGYEKDTEPMNPITFPLNRESLNVTGEYNLSLQMITKWNKGMKEREEVYRLDSETARTLHPATSELNTPRLLCALQRNGVTDWDTFCLSDFIRSPKPSRERASSVITDKNRSPDRKRSKTED